MTELRVVDSNLEKLNVMIREEAERLNALKSEHERMVPGQLYVRKNGNAESFRLVDSHGSRSISKNDAMLPKHIRKQVCYIQMLQSEAYLNILKDAANKMQTMDVGPKEVRRRKSFDWFSVKLRDPQYALRREDYKFYLLRNSQNNYEPNNLRYITNSGIQVRSKSERTIANKLDEYGILYNYEPALVVEGTTIYPDFYIKRRNGEYVIWEHFGLINDPDYLKRAQAKLAKYKHMGYAQYNNLICTYEDDIRSEHTIDLIVRNRLL